MSSSKKERITIQFRSSQEFKEKIPKPISDYIRKAIEEKLKSEEIK
jgi:hypothetical protein